MPFGPCNAPATFERLMDKVLQGLPLNVCLVYLDDILVHGKTFKAALHHLSDVFERLRQANLKLNPKKCSLFQKRVRYLGHIVSENGMETDPDKTDYIRNWPQPHSHRELKSFLGLCTYYRRFVKNFATMAKPLYTLTEQNTKFHWNMQAEEAFLQLKNTLTVMYAPRRAEDDKEQGTKIGARARTRAARHSEIRWLSPSMYCSGLNL